MTVQEEISYLANALSDEQRKAMFAKMGGGSGGGGNRQVYTRSGLGGGSGGGGSGVGQGMTVSMTRNGTSGGGYHYTGADDMTSSWVTRLSPDQMKEELKNDPDRLRAAIEEQLRIGAYDGISINGHKPSVNDIINGGIAPNYVPPQQFVTASELQAMKSDPLGGATAQAINLDGSRFSGLSPSDQAKQDVSVGSGGASGGGSGGSSGSVGGASAGGAVSLPDAIDTLPSGGSSGGGTGDGGFSAPNYLQEFLDALALAHF